MEPYLKSNAISLKKKRILFQAQTKMLNVKCNFGNQFFCPLCKLKLDNQEHLLECIMIKVKCPDILENKKKCEYNDIYSTKLEKLANISDLLLQAIRMREILLSQ